MSAFLDSSLSRAPQRSLEIDSAPEGSIDLQLLARARSALAGNDLRAFSVACQRWLRATHGVALGDGVSLQRHEQPLEMVVEDFALSWSDDEATAEPLLLLYGLTVQADGQQVLRQWNRASHDTRLEKLARPSDALIGYLAQGTNLAPPEQDDTVRVLS